MKRIGLTLIAALALCLPALAQAQEAGKLDCAISAVSPEFKSSIAAGLTTKGNDDAMAGLTMQLRALTDECARKWKIDPQLYFDYSLARIAREWMIPALRRWSLDTDIVDRVFDFRLGGPELDLSGGLPAEKGQALVEAFRASGLDMGQVPEEAWLMVGGYIYVTATYWRSLALLTR